MFFQNLWYNQDMNRQSNKNFKFKHSLGQNFIIDEFLLEDIADESGINKDDYVLEIGPGNGALTRCLCDRAGHVISIEIDKTLIPLLSDNLKEYNNISILNADFMEYDFNNIISEFEKFGFKKFSDHIKVVSNLPYYITSPIINMLLFNPYVNEMTIMVQKEVAERIIATPGGKDFGVLTLACNYFSSTEMIFIVSKDCFFPKPKVDSAVVRFIKHKEYIDTSNETNFCIEEDPSYKKLFSIIKASFSQRRKKLSNSLSNVLNLDKEKVFDIFQKLGFPENVRAENLSLEDYQKLSSLL